jgi:hypothetical protein
MTKKAVTKRGSDPPTTGKGGKARAAAGTAADSASSSSNDLCSARTLNAATLLCGAAVAAAMFVALNEVHEQYCWWSLRDEQGRESLFESESALYYSYMKDVVNDPGGFVAGLRGLIDHNRTEHPHRMNVIQRFNIFQEILCAALWKLWPAASPADPITFYVRAIFALWSAGVGWMFVAAARLSGGNLAAGGAAVALLLCNWNECGRVHHLPPLRENQSIPLLFLQVLIVTGVLRRVGVSTLQPQTPPPQQQQQQQQQQQPAPTVTAADMALITVATAAYMLPWQLAHTLMCVQTLALLAVHLLGYLPRAAAARIAASFLGALGVVMVMHFGGNAMFLWNSNFAQVLTSAFPCAFLVLLLTPD